jgi:hypothetical protein
MENFPGTRNLTILMRYTEDEKNEEREQAANSLKGTFSKVKILSILTRWKRRLVKQKIVI